jgi:hypothetical protein
MNIYAIIVGDILSIMLVPSNQVTIDFQCEVKADSISVILSTMTVYCVNGLTLSVEFVLPSYSASSPIVCVPPNSGYLSTLNIDISGVSMELILGRQIAVMILSCVLVVAKAMLYIIRAKQSLFRVSQCERSIFHPELILYWLDLY